MRVLFLASYFPRPGRPLMGTWALEQARALNVHGNVRVVVCTPYVPHALGMLSRVRPWVRVPHEHTWPLAEGTGVSDGLGIETTYLRVPYYSVKPIRYWAHRNPWLQMNPIWATIRGRLLKIVDEFRPDVVYCHHTAVSGYLGERIRHFRKIPFVVTDHEFSEITDCDHLPRRRELFEQVKRAAYQNVCVCARMEADTRRLFPGCRATTVHNGINPLPADVFTTSRPAELRGKQIVLSVGMLVKRKAFPELIAAFKAVHTKHPRAVLRIVGDGPNRPAVEAAIAAHGLADKVTLLGLRNPKEVFQEMAWADLFALVGWDEPFGVVFAEAMGAGLPVIAASDCGIADLVRHGEHGLLVPPHEGPPIVAALDALLSDDVGRRAMGLRARSMVEKKLSWDANARQMYDIFEEAVAAQRAPQAAAVASQLVVSVGGR